MTVSLSRPSVSSPGCRHAITLSAPDCACRHLNHLAIAGARPPQVLRVNEAGGAPSHVPARRTAEALDGSRATHPTPPQGTLIACRGPALHASAHHGALDSPLHLKDGSATGAERGGAEAGASGSAAAGGGGAMADDEEGGGSGGGGPTSPSRAQRQHLAAGSVARLAKSPLVQLASLLLADRQVLLMVSDCMPISSLISAARVALLLADWQEHQVRAADTEEAEPELADEEKEAKEELELGVRCGQMVLAMAPIEPALTNWAAYVEVRSPASDGQTDDSGWTADG